MIMIFNKSVVWYAVYLDDLYFEVAAMKFGSFNLYT